jgi:hypothetical protein
MKKIVFGTAGIPALFRQRGTIHKYIPSCEGIIGW